jgi:hypothetical protein
MNISNKKVDLALEKLENLENEVFSLRTELTRPDITSYRSKKYFLYQATNNGVLLPDTYGALIEAFKTQKEFIKYVNEILEEDKKYQEYLKSDEYKKIKEEEEKQRQREYEEYKKDYELQIKTMYDD